MTTDFRALPTQERLRELFRYEPKEGALYWIKRHNSQIDLSKPAGWRQQNGYHGMTVDGVRYKRHRIVWCYFNGDPGGFEIDHINGVKADDRIENLRLATRSENQYNRPVLSTNKTGLKGVSRHQWGKWRAQITNPDGRNTNLGHYDTPEQAAAAYASAASEIQRDYAHQSTRITAND
jgi:hypothetical protein